MVTIRHITQHIPAERRYTLLRFAEKCRPRRHELFSLMASMTGSIPDSINVNDVISDIKMIEDQRDLKIARYINDKLDEEWMFEPFDLSKMEEVQ